MVSHYKLGVQQQAAQQFQKAIGDYQAGVAVLDQMIERGQSVAASQKEKAMLEQAITTCQTSLLATQPWDQLLKLPEEQIPNFLLLRITLFAQQNRFDDVSQASETLRTLKPQTADQQYNAACGYGLCAQILTRRKQPLTEEETARSDRALADALTCLKEAVTLGYTDFEHLQQDTDLTAVRGTAAFQKWIKTLSAK